MELILTIFTLDLEDIIGYGIHACSTTVIVQLRSLGGAPISNVECQLVVGKV